MGFWDGIGDSILGMGGPLTGIGIGKWILLGIGACIGMLLLLLTR